MENLHIFSTPEELAVQLADELTRQIEASDGTFNLAISGGKTPDLLFEVLAKKNPHSSIWQKVHFWWVDERMVPPDHPESNFGAANRLLFNKIEIPGTNIHRIKGENIAEDEAKFYAEQIVKNLPVIDGWPVFDLVLLGMGDDGHTASIFPDQMQLLKCADICAVAVHPASGQKRVTLTGRVINQAKALIFMVTGENKSERIFEIFSVSEKAKLLPAAHIKPAIAKLSWYLDQSAVRRIGQIQ